MQKLEFSSAILTEDLRSKAIKDVFSNQLLMDLDPLEDCRQAFDFKALSTPTLNLACLSGSPAQATRTLDQAASSTEDLVLCVTYNADVRIQNHKGREQVFGSGDAHIWKADKKFLCEVNNTYATMMFHLPTSTLEATNIDPDRLFDDGKLEATPGLHMLTGYTRLLMSEFSDLTPEMGELALQHIRDLALFSLGTVQERKSLDMQNSVQAFRLASLKKDIENNLSHPDLSAEWVANREGISARYLRSLFLQERTNFTQYVLERKLQKAYGKLTNPSFRFQNISHIAFDVGFGDLSYFIRCFKKRFDATPSDIRRSYFSN